jgi:hypothetical protein
MPEAVMPAYLRRQMYLQQKILNNCALTRSIWSIARQGLLSLVQAARTSQG